MAHQQQIDFINKVKQLYPEYFTSVRVLDLGSFDINGNNCIFFKDFEYVGVDVAYGSNVNVACNAHEYKDNRLFDIVISTEMLEHDPYYKESLCNACDLLKSKGMLLFTCASKNRKIHGIPNVIVEDNPLGAKIHGSYYKNIDEDDVRRAVMVNKLFNPYCFQYEPIHCDLYFYGIKK